MTRRRWIALGVLFFALASTFTAMYVDGWGFFGGGRRSSGGGGGGVPTARTITITGANCIEVTPGTAQDLSANRSWTIDGADCLAGGTDLTGDPFITKTASANLSNEFALASLATGALINTTTTGIPTVFGGESCTNQVFTGTTASLDFTCTTLLLTGAYFANQGTTTTVLHGNAAGNLTFGAVHLVNDVTGLPGSDTQCLFNDAGVIGADAGCVFNKTTNVQTLGSLVTTQQAGASIGPYNTGAGQTGELRFLELAAGGSNYVALKSGDARAGNITYVWPTDDPTAGQVLSAGAPSAGVSVLDWVDQGGGTDVSALTLCRQGIDPDFTGVHDVDCTEIATLDMLMFDDTAGVWFNIPVPPCNVATEALTLNSVGPAFQCVGIGGGSGDITAVWGCSTGDCSTLTAAAGDTLDAGSADASSPTTRSTSLPGTCTEGQHHQDTDSGGSETYICTAANTWVKVVGANDLAVADGATLGIAAFTAADFNTAAGVVSIDYTNGQAASASTKGFVTAADYTTLKKAYLHLPITGAKLPTTNPCVIDNSETNARLLCDATTAENAFWQFVMPPDYGTALTVRVLYSMTSGTSGGVSINASVMAVTPGDAADINTESYDTTNNCDDATVPGTAGHLDQIVCTLTNADSAAAGDLVKVKIERAVADSADTATGDMEIVGIILEWTKS